MSDTLTRSFAGGVLTPEMFGRLDMTKFQTGLAEAVNFIILPHGPAANRAGTEHVLEVKDSTKLTCLIPFVYSTTQSMVLELGNQYIRFHTQAGTLLEAPGAITGVTIANPGVITQIAHGYTTGHWIFVAGINGPIALNGRFFIIVVIDVDHYYLTDFAGVPINTIGMPVYAGGGTGARVYEIASPYTTNDLFDLHYTQSNDVLTVVDVNYQQSELRRLGVTNWTLTSLGFAPTIVAPAAPAAAVAVGSGAGDNIYVTTAVAAGSLEESYASPPSANAVNNLTVAGNYNVVTSALVTGAIRYNIYRLFNGLYGFIGQTDGATLIDNNIAPDTTRTPPLADNVLASANNYPGAVGYYQQRRWFAGTLVDPQRVLATRVGTEGNMSYSIPTIDSDRLSFKVTARQANTIRHIVPLEDVILLTSGGVWVVSAAGGSGPITGSSVDVRIKSTIGASNVQPPIVGQAVIYAYDRGNRMREFAFRGSLTGGYTGVDISIMVPHYFDKFRTTQMSFAQSPYPIVWAVRNDGTLLGMTYVPEQQVNAWHSHTTSGAFESVCSVPEGTEDAVYVIVRRVINGRTVRHIERLHSRLFATLADCFFLDDAVAYNGAPATTFTGLWHLEGRTVNALADGAVVKDLVVHNGSVTLPHTAGKVCIGLPLIAQLKTLPLALEQQAAAGQGTQKNVNYTHLRVNESSSIFVGPSYDKLKQFKQRTNEPYGSPPRLISDEIRVVLSPEWNPNAQVCVEQPDPLPLTVLSLVLDTAVGG